ncbi:hypothetical protein ACFL1X_12625 [Candidatus Hydrogenedentota bacterium]
MLRTGKYILLCVALVIVFFLLAGVAFLTAIELPYWFAISIFFLTMTGGLCFGYSATWVSQLPENAQEESGIRKKRMGKSAVQCIYVAVAGVYFLMGVATALILSMLSKFQWVSLSWLFVMVPMHFGTVSALVHWTVTCRGKQKLGRRETILLFVLLFVSAVIGSAMGAY